MDRTNWCNKVDAVRLYTWLRLRGRFVCNIWCFLEAKITEFAHCLVLELYTTKRISFDYSNLENVQAILKLQQFVNWQV